jgi:beta-glucosidase/6-phospho-beta-glucosidase/beta-galactosidase
VSERPRVLATLDGYAVEGGLDQPGEPATCWRPTIALGRHAGPGDAHDLWTNYETVIDLAAAIGLDGVRLDLEWARIEPRRGAIDVAALARYRAVVGHARSKGLGVTGVLVDAAWPAWLGLEAWLLPWVEPCAVAHARVVAGELGDLLTGLVTFADPQGIVARGFVEGTAPPWRRGAIVDAAFATAQVSRIDATLRDDELVGALLVGATRTVSLERPATEVAAALATPALDEVYLRSLVRGVGPTAAPIGLVARDDGEWRTDVPDDLRAVLAGFASLAGATPQEEEHPHGHDDDQQ